VNGVYHRSGHAASAPNMSPRRAEISWLTAEVDLIIAPGDPVTAPPGR